MRHNHQRWPRLAGRKNDSALELLWDRNVERAHGLPISSKQVPFKKKDGTTGYRDREYSPWGLIIEFGGKRAQAGEQWDND